LEFCGKGLAYGGSLIQKHRVVYFAEQILNLKDQKIKAVSISGFGGGFGGCFKVNDLGGKVVTISGPDGYIYDEEGILVIKIDFMLEMRARGDNRAEAYLENIQNSFHKGKVFGK
jgi:glutamate dehydrogenase (NADP+)